MLEIYEELDDLSHGTNKANRSTYIDFKKRSILWQIKNDNF